MKLKNVHIENLKCFNEYDLDLRKPGTDEPLSVCALVGPNGCGKSTIMEAIVTAMTIADGEYGGKILDEKAIKYNSHSYQIELNFLLSSNSRKLLKTRRRELPVCAGKFLAVDDEEKKYQNIFYYPREARLFSEADDEKDRVKKEQAKYKKIIEQFWQNENSGIMMYFDAFRYLTALNPNGINMDSILSSPRKDSLRSNIGSDDKISNKYYNVKQWLVNLDYLKLKEEGDYYKKVYDHVLRAFDLLFKPLNFLQIDTKGNIVFQDGETGERVDIDMLSDGFKSLFAIVGAMIMRLSIVGNYGDEPFYMNEAIILIDEIDCHIHPKWQRNIIPGLRTLFPNCQYIVSTHSPYILESIQEYEIHQIGERKIV